MKEYETMIKVLGVSCAKHGDVMEHVVQASGIPMSRWDGKASLEFISSHTKHPGCGHMLIWRTEGSA